MTKIEKIIKQVVERIPSKTVNNLRIALLQKWNEKEETVIIFPKPKFEKYPAIYFFGFLAKDWHGLAATTMGVVTEKWNMATHWGISIPYKDDKIGMVIFGIEVENKDKLAEISKEQNEVRHKLYKACFKGWRKHILIKHGAKKIEIFEEVMESIKKNGKLEYELAEEITKFFDSRGEEYLEERGTKELVEIILTNYEFIQKTRKTNRKLQVKVKHLHTKREKLTGITITCRDSDFSLLLALDAIREVSPLTIRYNKEFITPDNISVYRIEIDGYQNKKRITKSIMRKIITRKFEQATIKQIPCGFEQYSRAIIPKLIKDYNSSLIPQVYISPDFMAPEFIHFKIIVVKNISSSWTSKAIRILDKIKGFAVLGSEPPKAYQNAELNIFDLKVNTSVFSDTDYIYSTIRENIRKILGEFRDFDEGMRKMDIDKFAEVKRKVKGATQDLLKEIYYGIEDFCRVNACDNELIEIVKLGVKLSKSKVIPNIKYLNIAEKCTIIGISSRKKILSKVLKVLTKYETGVSKIQNDGINLLLLRIEKKGKSLPQDEIESTIQRITNLLHKKLR